MNWHIGMDIVCIKTHSKGLIKEGDIFTIESLRQGCCSIQIDIGINDTDEACNYTTICTDCGGIINNGSSSTLWFHECLFAPLDSLVNISEIEEILSQPIETLFEI